MAYPSSLIGDTIYIYLYYVHYAFLLAPIHSHKVITFPGPFLGHWRPQLTLIPTKYPEPTQATTKLPHQALTLIQMSSTGFSPRSIISSRCCSSRSGVVIVPNRSRLRPNISNRCWGSNNLHQVAITLLTRLWDYSQLSPTDTSVAQIVSNCRCDLMKYRLTMPGLLKPAPWLPQSRLKYWLALVLWRSRQRFPHIYEWLTVFAILNPVWLAHFF